MLTRASTDRQDIEMRTGEHFGRIHFAGGEGSGWDCWPGKFFRTLVILFAFVGAQAAPIQLLSLKSTSRVEDPVSDAYSKSRAHLSESFGQLPLSFEAVDPGASRFRCRGLEAQVWLSPVEAVLTFNRAWKTPRELTAFDGAAARATGHAPQDAPLRIKWVGANPNARAAAAGELPTKLNYFIGNNPAQWRRQVSNYGRVRYRAVYPGIDLEYYGNQRQLEYDFVVAPGANPDAIAWCYEGAETIQVDGSGDLIVNTAGGQVRQHRPVAYQSGNGERKEISASYSVRDDGSRRVGFEIGAYDRTQPLIIDPVLVYSALLGGAGLDKGWDIAVDTNGCVYLTGETASTDFPTNNALFPTNSSIRIIQRDVFVAKLDAEGTNLVFSTYLGGSGDDAAYGIALDGAGNVYLTGATASPDFPFPAAAASAISTNLHGSPPPRTGIYPYDAFVVKLDAAGSNLLYSTFVGGTQSDAGMGIAVDNAGQIYVTGATSSEDFPTNGTTRTFAGGVHDAFVFKLRTDMTNLIYSSYLGGTGDDYGFGVAVDALGGAVTLGLTTSALDFPLTNAIQTNFAGGPYDVFIAKFSPDGASQVFSTYYGGDGDNEARRVVVDNQGNICFAGFTTSLNFPTNTSALYPTNRNLSAGAGIADAFVVKLDPSGTNLIYSTYLGGSFNDEAWGIAADTNGNVYVVGRTSSPDFPTTNAYQSVLSGAENVFVAKLNSNGTALDYSTFLGGLLSNAGYGIAVDPAGNAYITGSTGSPDFPIVPATNTAGSVFAGDSDAFVAKLFPRNAELRPESSGVGAVTIRWPYGLPHFELQSADDLAPTNLLWAVVTNPVPTVAGDDYLLTFTNLSGNQFFRLRRNQ